MSSLVLDVGRGQPVLVGGDGLLQDDTGLGTGLSDQEWMDSQIAGFEALARSGRFPAFARTLASCRS